jgi:hypothetical protein
MIRRHRASNGSEAGRREHRAVLTNLMAMQARLRGDAVIPVHPSARIGPVSAGSGGRRATDVPAPDADPAATAAVIPLPGAASRPVTNPTPPSDVEPSPSPTLEELQDRIDRLEAELVRLLDRVEPGAAAAARRGNVEEAIVRLQRAIDRRLGSS